MPFINYVTKEINFKLVYYGPGLGGKTTNLKYIYSKLDSQTKGRLITLATEVDRTLFFDFLPVDLGTIRNFRARFHLYTVPGQVFYDASRWLILRGVDGIVFVADSQRERSQENLDSLENMKSHLKSYGRSLSEIPHVFQYNKRDLLDLLSVEELEALLNLYRVPSFEAIATQGVGVFETLRELARLVVKVLK